MNSNYEQSCQFTNCSISVYFLQMMVKWIKLSYCYTDDRLCGLVIRVPGYRSRGPVFDSRRYQIFWEVGLERGPLNLASTIEQLLERKSIGSGLENITAVEGPPRWLLDTPLCAKVRTNFAD
jgi:hypothetical protein